MNLELDMLCDRLLAGLLTGGYQGLLLTATVWALLKATPGTNAATRHGVAFATLLLAAALTVVHGVLPNNRTNPGPSVANSPIVSGEPSQPTAALSNPTGTPISVESTDSPITGSQPGPQTAHSPLDPDPELSTTGREREPFAFASEKRLLETRLWPETTSTTAFSTVRPNPDANMLPFESSARVPGLLHLGVPKWVGRLFLFLWIPMVLIRLAGLARQCRWLFLVKHRSAPATQELLERFEPLRAEMGVTRPAQLLLCSENIDPIAVGFATPAVLLPETLASQADPDHLNQIIRHELAHIRRHDDWTTLIQELIHAVLFCNPAVWWLIQRLRVEREIACDDHVITAARARRGYALLLTEFASRKRARLWTAAPAAWNNQSQLKERISMILDPNRNASPRPALTRVGLLTTLAIVLAGLGLHTAPRVALAQTTAKSETAPTPPPSQETRADLPGPARTVTAPAKPAPAPAPAPSPPRMTAARNASAAPLKTIESGPLEKPVLGSSPTAVSERGALPHPVTQAVAPILAIEAPSPPQPLLERSDQAPVALPAPAAVPAPPTSPTPAALPPQAPMKVQAKPAPPKTFVPSDPRHSKGPDTMSLERRIERLERMVESLLEREKEKGMTAFSYWKLPNGATLTNYLTKMERDLANLSKELPKAGLSPEENARIAEKVQRETEKATREVERAFREANRAFAEAGRYAEKQSRPARPTTQRQELESRRQALQAQRQALEQQIQAAQHQIEQIKKQQQLLEEQQKLRDLQQNQKDDYQENKKIEPDSDDTQSDSNP